MTRAQRGWLASNGEGQSNPSNSQKVRKRLKIENRLKAVALNRSLNSAAGRLDHYPQLSFPRRGRTVGQP
jgi:hypothetical protein